MRLRHPVAGRRRDAKKDVTHVSRLLTSAEDITEIIWKKRHYIWEKRRITYGKRDVLHMGNERLLGVSRKGITSSFVIHEISRLFFGKIDILHMGKKRRITYGKRDVLHMGNERLLGVSQKGITCFFVKQKISREQKHT